ncbi:unnamed protein product [Brassica rapa]|uniref:Uncharacterized protein n=1 Tax=Brassica campestris TaxID=3711 RepID=A0A8D9CN94_BRACM|nr:unnamed protein product [Brassica rapa]
MDGEIHGEIKGDSDGEILGDIEGDSDGGSYTERAGISQNMFQATILQATIGDYRVSDNYLKELSPHFEESIQIPGARGGYGQY